MNLVNAFQNLVGDPADVTAEALRTVICALRQSHGPELDEAVGHLHPMTLRGLEYMAAQADCFVSKSDTATE